MDRKTKNQVDERWQRRELEKRHKLTPKGTYRFDKRKIKYEEVKPGYKLKWEGHSTEYTVQTIVSETGTLVLSYDGNCAAFTRPDSFGVAGTVWVVGIDEQIYNNWKKEEEEKERIELEKYERKTSKRSICLREL